VPWPHDALRHSYASYHLAKSQNAPALALELGHQSNTLIIPIIGGGAAVS
jgi:hypothetical protein